VTGPDPRVLGPGLAPTPFTAHQIREQSAPGRLVTSYADGPGAEPVRITNHYLSCDDDGAEIQRTEYAPDGSVLEQETGRTTWLELQRHAAFPADRTTIEPVVLEGPLGPLDCLLYTVTSESAESAESAVRRSWFATARPGMPVRVETVQDGVVTGTRFVVAYDVVHPDGG